MATQISFEPMGKTFVANVSTTLPQTIAITADSPCNQYYIYSPSTDVFVRISSSAGNSVVSIPTTGIPAYGIAVEQSRPTVLTGWQSGPNSNVTISICANANVVSAIFAYITPGEGIS